MRYLSLLVLVFSTLLPVDVRGQSPQVGGFLSLDKRVNVGTKNVVLEDFYNRFRGELSASPDDQLYLFSSLDVRFYDLPRVRTIAGLEDPGETFPMDVSLWESYADIYGFLFSDLDLRVGKQRVAWGTADKLNPTDNLNPNDFSDLLHFTDKIPTWAVRGTYYLGDYQLTSAWLPSLTPVLLPRGGASLFLGDELLGFSNTVQLPGRGPENSMFAFKIGGRVGVVDYSLSYFNGYDDIPVVRRVRFSASSGQTPGGEVTLGFPAMQVFGVDAAAEWRGIGLWTEAGLFWPERVVTRRIAGSSIQEVVTLDDQPYLKLTAGGDYTFSNGLYLNGQWMHGFSAERGQGALHDYLFVSLEQTVVGENLFLRLGGAGEVARWDNLDRHVGFSLMPELQYQAIDNLEVTLGGFIVDGTSGTLFHTWRKVDQIYLRFRIDF